MGSNMDAQHGQVSLPARAVRITIPVLGLVGMGISGYLTYIHYRWVEPVCFAGLDCNSVLFSPYAVIWGIPVSLLGLIMYSVLTAGGLFLLHKNNQLSSLSAMGVYTLALSGTLYSIFLISREFKMHAFCSWCLASALVITCILVLSLFNLATFGVRVTEIPNLISAKLSEGRHLFKYRNEI
jgi:uncharacterized membrane protein